VVRVDGGRHDSHPRPRQRPRTAAQVTAQTQRSDCAPMHWSRNPRTDGSSATPSRVARGRSVSWLPIAKGQGLARACSPGSRVETASAAANATGRELPHETYAPKHYCMPPATAPSAASGGLLAGSTSLPAPSRRRQQAAQGRRERPCAIHRTSDVQPIAGQWSWP
jgi:hypothetical protein